MSAVINIVGQVGKAVLPEEVCAEMSAGMPPVPKGWLECVQHIQSGQACHAESQQQ